MHAAHSPDLSQLSLQATRPLPVTAHAQPSRIAIASFYLYYVALYAPVAIAISFFPVWIRAQGLSEQQTGMVLALGAALAVLVNPAVGAMADQYRSRKAILLALAPLSMPIPVAWIPRPDAPEASHAAPVFPVLPVLPVFPASANAIAWVAASLHRP
nr:MFS transporter [Cupriavidus basilensis]